MSAGIQFEIQKIIGDIKNVIEQNTTPLIPEQAEQAIKSMREGDPVEYENLRCASIDSGSEDEDYPDTHIITSTGEVYLLRDYSDRHISFATYIGKVDGFCFADMSTGDSDNYTAMHGFGYLGEVGLFKMPNGLIIFEH